MKIRIQEVKESYEALNELANKELPVRASFVLASNMKVLAPFLETLQTNYAELIEKYGARDDDGNVIHGENGTTPIKKECIQDFITESNALMDTEIEVAITTINISAFDEAQVKAKLLLAISYMLE